MLFIVMAIAAVGMVFGLAKDKTGAAWGKPLTIACAILALLIAVVKIVGGGSGSVNLKDAREREIRYEEVAAETLGGYLAENYGGSRALVIRSIAMPNTEDPLTEARLRGLRQGLGNQVEIVAVVSPEIPEEYKQYMAEMPEGPEGEEMAYMAMGPMMDSMLQAESFNKILNEQKGNYDLIISTIGLPMDLENLVCWSMDPKPPVALLNTMQLHRLKEAIRQGFVAGVVSYRPDPEMNVKKVPSDREEAFAQRYLLITKDNVDEIAAQYEALFPEME